MASTGFATIAGPVARAGLFVVGLVVARSAEQVEERADS